MFISLKITLIISLIWHILCMGLLEPTFDKSLKGSSLCLISFLGPILNTSDLSSGFNLDKIASHSNSLYAGRISQMNFKISPLYKKDIGYFSPLKTHIRPIYNPNFNNIQKVIFKTGLESNILRRYSDESSVIFHPRLPYSFLIYFKDRQRAHIEFTFYISGKGEIAFIKRNISSGNLEVDLLASRYITRHLSLVKDQFPTNSWQTVKIDLTRKDD